MTASTQTRHSRWVAARNWFYDALCHEQRRVAAQGRFLGTANPDSRSLPGHLAHQGQEAEAVDRAAAMYERMVTTSGRVGAAYGNPAEFDAALDEADALLEDARPVAFDAFGNWFE